MIKLSFNYIVILSLLAAAACAPRKTVKKPLPSEGSPAAADAGEALPPSVEVAEASLRGTEFTSIPELRDVTFDYDAYALTDQAGAILQENAGYLKAHSDLEVLVSGHCDERGTIQYNLALGQKRAKAVRDYYIRLGVNGRAVATISYGEERPGCADSTEECWSRNRRSETRARARVVSNGKRRSPPTP